MLGVGRGRGSPSQRFPSASVLIIQRHEHSAAKGTGQPLRPESEGWAGSEGLSWGLGPDLAWRAMPGCWSHVR